MHEVIVTKNNEHCKNKEMDKRRKNGHNKINFEDLTLKTLNFEPQTMHLCTRKA